MRAWRIRSRLDAEAERRQRSRSFLVAEAVREYLSRLAVDTGVLCPTAISAHAQDAVQVDPKHYLPGGTSQQAAFKAGSIAWDSGGTHLPENVSGKSFELIVVELKAGKGP